ncbi:MAG: hypothetical protein FJ255_12120 [Phycisphaerae bacterium]|nr:hypothetical protein [Phycisphaerae bacterium]
MKFDMVDRVLELAPERAVTLKQVTAAEEYLQDHFPGFPVLPGVLMLEAMVQAARRMLERFGPPGLSGPQGRRAVIARVRALKYGYLVKPGCTLRIEVARLKDPGDGTVEFKGEVYAIEPRVAPAQPAIAASGRITLHAPAASSTLAPP